MTQTIQNVGRGVATAAKQPEGWLIPIFYVLADLAKDAKDTTQFAISLASITIIVVAYIAGRAYINTRNEP